MSRTIRRLNRALVIGISEPGSYNEGNGFYLIVKKSCRKLGFGKPRLRAWYTSVCGNSDCPTSAHMSQI